jgi:hypothetical protein
MYGEAISLIHYLARSGGMVASWQGTFGPFVQCLDWEAYAPLPARLEGEGVLCLASPLLSIVGTGSHNRSGQAERDVLRSMC